MIFRIIPKENVMDFLGDENLYVLKAYVRNDKSTHCVTKQAYSLTLMEVMKAIADDNTAFVEITKES